MIRRDFMAGILAACCSPAIVRADSLMRIVPRRIAQRTPTYLNKGDIFSISGKSGLFVVTFTSHLIYDPHAKSAPMTVTEEKTNGTKEI